jgi:protein-tyrosine phosphatase
VIDLHCHVLPAIDDGPGTIEGSLALARAAAGGGARTLVATPHINRVYHNDADTIASLVGALNARLADEKVAIEVRAGAEIATAQVAQVPPPELQRLGLGGGPWLLVEPPFTTAVSGLDATLRELQRRGHRIVLAHPERCPGLHRAPQTLAALVREGVLTSITAGSLVGRFGADVRRFALALAADGLVHNVASDAHDDARRPPGMVRELEQAGLGPLTEWLTQDVPAAILSGETIPPRPSIAIPRVRPRRSLWRPHRH